MTATDKYGTWYWSSSKQVLVNIEDMHDRHLLNAYRKLRDKELPGLQQGGHDTSGAEELLEDMKAELAERNLDPQYQSGRPPEPPPLDEPEEDIAF